MKRIPPYIAVCSVLLSITVCGVSFVLYRRADSVRDHFAQAELYVQAADGPKAEAEWQAVLQADPRNIPAHELLAEYYLSRQNWKKGADAFQKLYELAPRKEHVLCKLAACQLRMDNQKAAFDTAYKEIQISPDCVAALGLYTTLMAARPGKDEKQLIIYLRRLAKLQPDDLEIQRFYAEALTNQYLYDELRPVVAHILQLNPQDAQAYNLGGLADLARADQPQGAQDAARRFQHSLEITDKAGRENGGAHFGLGRAYLHLHEPEKAVRELEQAVRLLPNLVRASTELANAYQQTGQSQKSKSVRLRVAAMERAVGERRVLTIRCNAYPKNPDYPVRLAELSLQAREFDKAVYYLERAAKLRPDDARIKRLLVQARRSSTGSSPLEDKGGG